LPLRATDARAGLLSPRRRVNDTPVVTCKVPLRGSIGFHVRLPGGACGVEERRSPGPRDCGRRQGEPHLAHTQDEASSTLAPATNSWGRSVGRTPVS
jgi:hypothetical protein